MMRTCWELPPLGLPGTIFRGLYSHWTVTLCQTVIRTCWEPYPDLHWAPLAQCSVAIIRLSDSQSQKVRLSQTAYLLGAILRPPLGLLVAILNGLHPVRHCQTADVSETWSDSETAHLIGAILGPPLGLLGDAPLPLGLLLGRRLKAKQIGPHTLREICCLSHEKRALSLRATGKRHSNESRSSTVSR